jgi:tRNA threonylcarbamoyladenosine biosynthesis protein TsaE
MVNTRTFSIPTLAALPDVARLLAQAMKPGDVVALDGPMGAGKTTLTRALGEALGVQEAITSPTFTLIHHYLSGRLPLIHVDFYRLGPEGADALADEILSAYETTNAALLLEWSEYASFVAPLVTVRLTLSRVPQHEEGRLLTVSPASWLALESNE